MNRIIVLLAFVVMSLGSAFAQQMQDVVYLKNGSIIRGAVLEQVPGGNVKIQTADGSVFVYPMADVQKIQKEKSRVSTSSNNTVVFYNNPYKDSPAYQKKDADELYGWEKAPRFRGFVEQTSTFGVGDYDYDRYGLQASFGCQIIPYLYVGAGVGAEYWTDAEVWSAPIFAHVRTEFHKALGRNASPFVDVKAGYSVSDDIKGAYFAPSVGCHFYFGHSNVGISAYLGYVLQIAEIEHYYYNSYSHYGYHDYTNENCGGVRIGVALDF